MHKNTDRTRSATNEACFGGLIRRLIRRSSLGTISLLRSLALWEQKVAGSIPSQQRHRGRRRPVAMLAQISRRVNQSMRLPHLLGPALWSVSLLPYC